MSNLEKFYSAMATKWGSSRKWDDLHPQEQMMVVQAVNMLITVLNKA